VEVFAMPRPAGPVLTGALLVIAASCVGLAPGDTARSATPARASLGTLTGLVTDTKGHPLKGICVDGLPLRRHRFPASNTAGVYTDTVKPGKYMITFMGRSFLLGCSNTGNWLAQRHTNGKFPFKPTPVTVRAGHVTRVNAKLVLGGAITGRVTGRGGRLLAGICLQLYRFPDRYVASPNFGNIGLITGARPFALTSVPAGRYRILFFTDTCNNFANYAQRWWRDAPGIASARIITVRPGRVITGVSQRLPTGGSISGRVTGPGGVPLAGICIEFDGPKYPGYLDYVTTRPDGRYRINALLTHDYTVTFNSYGCGADSQYQQLQYPSPVKVSEGHVTAGINAQLSAAG
jgi:hypothetical protein